MTNILPGHIKIIGDLSDFKNNFIVFYDDGGESILAITRSSEYAMKLKKLFEGYLKEGRLLHTYKSAYRHNN